MATEATSKTGEGAEQKSCDWNAIVDDLNRLLRLRVTPIGMKLFEIMGESACAGSWGRALLTGEPSLSIPCFAERRYGGVLDDELLLAIPPRFLPGVIEGMKRLAKNGLRYPIPQYGIQSDARAGLGYSYSDKE